MRKFGETGHRTGAGEITGQEKKVLLNNIQRYQYYKEIKIIKISSLLKLLFTYYI